MTAIKTAAISIARKYFIYSFPGFAKGLALPTPFATTGKAVNQETIVLLTVARRMPASQVELGSLEE